MPGGLHGPLYWQSAVIKGQHPSHLENYSFTISGIDSCTGFVISVIIAEEITCAVEAKINIEKKQISA